MILSEIESPKGPMRLTFRENVFGDSLNVQTSKNTCYITVFISPETAQLAEWKVLFSDPILRAKIAVVAVDEAHCISEWYIII